MLIMDEIHVLIYSVASIKHVIIIKHAGCWVKGGKLFHLSVHTKYMKICDHGAKLLRKRYAR